MKCEFIPIDYDYFDFEDRNYVKIVGKTLTGKKICVVDLYEANFWVVLKDGAKKKDIDLLIKKIEGITVEKGSRVSVVLKTELCKKKFLEKDVDAIRIYVTNHKDCHLVAAEIGDSDSIIVRREYDIPLITKYIMEGGLEPSQYYSIDGDVLGDTDFGGLVDSLEVDLCLRVDNFNELEGKEKDFMPKVLAYDIETTTLEVGKGEILMISIFGDGIKKVLTWKKCSGAQDYVSCFKTEGEMIEGFVECVKDFAPDVLCGYFSDGFDLPFLKERARQNKVSLGLGLDSSGPSFSRGILPTGKINGIVHVDLYRFVSAVYSQYLASETLSLNEVANELIGEKKEDFDFALLSNMNDKNWVKFFSYSLKDSDVTYKLFLKIWPDLLEFTKIIKEPLFDVSRDRMATHVENYILHNLGRFNEIAQKRPMGNKITERKALGKFEGAFVYEPTPGFYEDIVMFDFTSMYGSVIVTYNLSWSTLSGGEEDNYTFVKKMGIFPTLLSEIIEMRKKYKKEFSLKKDNLSKARSNAYKLLANASYGYLGFYGARYYSREAASSTTRLARENIFSIIDKIKKKGYEVLYSDTDSIAFLRGNKSEKEILKFLDELNDTLSGIMELDLEDFYKRGIFVSKRGTKTGAKKKYALLEYSGKIKIRGFETVRRDWCRLARRLQSDILKSVLIDGNEEKAVALLKSIIKDLKDKKIDIKDLIIKTQLKKPLSEYVSRGPHVVAAERMAGRGDVISTGMIVEYYVGEGKGKKIGDKVRLPNEGGDYDVLYYLNNQILPAVVGIFEVFGVDVESFSKDNKQTGLDAFN